MWCTKGHATKLWIPLLALIQDQNEKVPDHIVIKSGVGMAKTKESEKGQSVATDAEDCKEKK